MKIAFVTDDGKMITQHFGRAGKYLVVEVEGEKEINRDLRDKFDHKFFQKGSQSHSDSPDRHFGADAHAKHLQMLAAIEDCDVVICGGMGRGAFQSIHSKGIEVFMTDTPEIDKALSGFLNGELTNMEDLIH